MDGELGILNVSRGHSRISFDPDGPPEERERAARMVRDMIRMGYLIAVEVDGELVPVKDFDETKHEYIVQEHRDDRKPRGKRGGTRRVAASRTRGIAVPRSAGG